MAVRSELCGNLPGPRASYVRHRLAVVQNKTNKQATTKKEQEGRQKRKRRSLCLVITFQWLRDHFTSLKLKRLGKKGGGGDLRVLTMKHDCLRMEGISTLDGCGRGKYSKRLEFWMCQRKFSAVRLGLKR